MLRLLVGFLLVLLVGKGDSYKPVVIIHGIFDHRNSLFPLMGRIMEKHSGSNVTIIDRIHGWRSMTPMWLQVKIFKRLIRPIMKENPGGIHLIGFSQGGLVARAVIQSMRHHNVHTFISLSSPQSGQYGDNFLKLFFPGYLKEKAWKLFYRNSGQHISIGNYWRDPHHLPEYFNHSVFLPLIDNQITSENSNHFKNNFMRLKKLVLIGGKDDGVISPWESSQFGCYDANEEVIPMESRDLYKRNTFGLRTLDERGKILRFSVDNIKHLEWHKNFSVIDNYIIPYLD